MHARPEVTRSKAAVFSIEERLAHGSFSIAEARKLAGVSNSKIYGDARRGLITILKRGAASYVPGRSLAAYMGHEIQAQ